MRPSLDLRCVNKASAVPVYQQLVELIRLHIADGRLQPGHEVPSVRTVGQALDVHPMTVSRAYAELEAEGILHRRPGRLMAVAAPSSRLEPNSERIADLQDLLGRAARRARDLGLSSNQAEALFRRLLERERPERVPG